jgi:hypothetical protein
MLQRGVKRLQASGRLAKADDEKDEDLVRNIVYSALSPVDPPIVQGTGEKKSDAWIVLLGMTN